MGWETCSQHIDEFNKFKPLYTPEYIQERKEEIIKVRRMPDNSGRSALREILRHKLLKKIKECTSAWLKVKSHLIEAFKDKIERESMISLIGHDLYPKVIRNQYDIIQKFMQSASEFITEYKSILVLNNNMPPEYEQEFKNLILEYDKLYGEYLETLKNRSDFTIEVAESHNKLYTDLINMFRDGKIIFKDNPSVRRLFVFKTNLGFIGGTNWAGIKGSVLSKDTKLQIPNLLVEIVETGQSTSTDESANFNIGPLTAGIYSLQLSAPNYQTQLITDIKVETGGYSTVNAELEPKEELDVEPIDDRDPESNS
ncbi:MAG: carboxypeptidase-like regulatory domain-containing protein [Bacteroidia bacterium]